MFNITKSVQRKWAVLSKDETTTAKKDNCHDRPHEFHNCDNIDSGDNIDSEDNIDNSEFLKIKKQKQTTVKRNLLSQW
jgi:hypothetical protein